MADYDVIVVGARCAGSSTAMLLARRGHRVLLVDRATFPSDTVSTLVIHAPGVALLRQWGLLDRLVATGCPPIERYELDFGSVVIGGTPHPSQGESVAYAPRRTVLDTLLVDAAREAGAEVREGFRVHDILEEGGVVTGIRGQDRDGRSVTASARIVVGADGWNSMVARAVGAERYHTKPVLEHAFYTFWQGLPIDRFSTYVRGDRGVASIPTNDGLTLVLVGCPFAQAAAFRGDVRASYLAAIELVPELAHRIRGATPVAPIVGGGVPNFFCTPFGPGWALVGDAGYTKDPVTAQGITDAFRSAAWCADALDAGLIGARTFDEALGEYHQRRDAGAMAIYEFTTQLAALEPPPPALQELLGAVAGNQAAMDAFVSVTAGTLSPAEFFDPAYLAKVLGGP